MSAPKELVLWGAGQLGRLYAGGALRAGYCVTPILRDTDPAPVLLSHAPGTPILCAVGEPELDAVVQQVPVDRRDDLVLLQNELFPSQLRQWQASSATLAVVWTLCKPRMPLIVSRPTMVGGRHAGAVAEWHAAIDLPCALADDKGMRVEAAAKYAFIVAINALGVRRSATVGEWQNADPQLVRDLVADAVRLGAALAEVGPLTQPVIDAVEAGLAGFRDLPTRGRTAHQRVERALEAARALQLTMPSLAAVAGT